MARQPRLSVLRILWFAMLLATMLYAGIAFSGIFKPKGAPLDPMMPLVFGLLSIVLTIVSFALPRTIYTSAARNVEVETREEALPDAFSARYREAIGKRTVFADPQAATAKAYSVFMTPFILSLALSEAIALFGMVLAALGFEKMVAAPFFAAGAVLIAVRFPSERKILGAFVAARGVSFPSSAS
ncbi:hypothetical protein [Polyangium jinanense]|uniref:Uncharacterized protein n=1 Tax=Polyangium jinanense TaxID=2829994 RepID=A0A9X3X0C4_9BACT|nr:hypothetical protein [Polyangium jinanense]MDC3952395.1 hypothetical protein [Polyangium jinanense]MDC3980023.1 hypothetical protein [Polyangium jinanense]